MPALYGMTPGAPILSAAFEIRQRKGIESKLNTPACKCSTILMTQTSYRYHITSSS